VHHVQIDDFNAKAKFILGPMNTGFNSKRHHDALTPDFKAIPWFSTCVELRDLITTMANLKKGVITLQTVEVHMGEMEASVDVPKLLQILFKLVSWVSIAETLKKAPDKEMDGKVLSQFQPGITVPASAQALLYLAELEISRICLGAELIFTQLDEKASTYQDPDAALQQIGPQLPPVAQQGLSALAHMSLSFAQVAPKFDFARVELNNLNGTITPITDSVVRNYTRQIASQAVAVLGSVRLLGDPAKVVGDVSSGFRLLYKDTREEMSGKRDTHLQGVRDFSEKVGGAAFGFFADLTGTWSDTIGGIAGAPLRGQAKPISLAEGVDKGMSVLSKGFSHGFTDVVIVPKDRISDYEEYGVSGVAVGGLIGVYSILGRPAEGMLGFIAQVSRGAEGSIHSRTLGSDGLRRPPREGFISADGKLPRLEEGFFWPSWEFTIDGITFPKLWEEPRVGKLAISLARAKFCTSVNQIIVLTRGVGKDSWAPWDDGEQAGVASGRVGELRGPFRIQVDVDFEGNVAFSRPFRQIAGYGELKMEDVINSLQGKQDCKKMTCEVKAIGSPLTEGECGIEENEVLGQLEITLKPRIESKVSMNIIPNGHGVEDRNELQEECR